jgi:phage shock protein PspC (stress-responsive transcriptional regulator)
MTEEGTPQPHPIPDPGPAPSPEPTPGDTATTALPGPDQQPTTVLAGAGAPSWTEQGVAPPTSPQPGFQQAGYGMPPGYQQAPYQAPYQQPYQAPYQAPYQQPPQQPSSPGPRRIFRSRSDRVVGGVCGGLARAWNTDPTLLRILAVVLTIATGGALLLGYLIAWIVMPEDPWQPQGGQGGPGYAAGGNPPYAGQGTATMAAAPRERSYLGWLVLSIAVLVAGVITLFGVALPSTTAAPAILGGVILAILGLGMVIGTWYGRARWLAVLAVPVALLTFGGVAANAFVQTNPNWDRWVVEGSDDQLAVGDRTWRVTTADVADSPLDYRVSAGAAVLDLRPLTAGGVEVTDPAQRLDISASVGVGELRVLVPDNVRLELDARVDLGEIRAPGSSPQGGTQQSLTTTLEPADGQPAAYLVTLDAAVGAGSITVEVF